MGDIVSYVIVCCRAKLSSMKRLKKPLRSAMSGARLTSLSVIHLQERKEIDLSDVISESCSWEERQRISPVRKTITSSCESYLLLYQFNIASGFRSKTMWHTAVKKSNICE